MPYREAAPAGVGWSLSISLTLPFPPAQAAQHKMDMFMMLNAWYTADQILDILANKFVMDLTKWVFIQTQELVAGN